MTEIKRASMTPEKFYLLLANRPQGLALETGRCFLSVDDFVTHEKANIASVSGVLINVSAGVIALEAKITALEAQLATGPPLTTDQQAAMDGVTGLSDALVTQVNTITTTPPGTPVPIVPLPIDPVAP